jgi:hypothetical protein
MRGRKGIQGIAGMALVLLLASLVCPGYAITASASSIIPLPEQSVGLSTQKKVDIALGDWKAPALSFRVVAEGGALQITDFRYSYVHSCNKCSLKVEKIPILDRGFRIDSQAGQFFLQGTFQDGRKLVVRLRSSSKSCALDQTLDAAPALADKSAHSEPKLR